MAPKHSRPLSPRAHRAKRAQYVNHVFTFSRVVLVKQTYSNKTPDIKVRKGQTAWIVDTNNDFTEFRVCIDGKQGRFDVLPGYGVVGGRKWTYDKIKDHRATLTFDIDAQGVKWKAGHDFGVIHGINDDGTIVSMAMISREKSGHMVKKLNLDIANVNISQQRSYDRVNVYNRRVTFIQDHSVNKHNGGPHVFKKDHVAIAISCICNVLRFADYVHKVDMDNHTFRVLRPVELTVQGDPEKKKIQLQKDDAGTIAKTLQTGQGRFIQGVQAIVRTRGGIAVNIPWHDMEVGPTVSRYRTTFKAPPMSTTTDKDKVGGLAKKAKDIRPLMRTFAATCVDNKDKLPGLREEIESMISKKTSRENLAQAFQDGIHTASPQLLEVLTRKDFTIEDVLKVAQEAQEGSMGSGIYLRVYWGFPETSRFHGKVYIYVGKARHFAERNRSHRNFQNTAAKRQSRNPHYRIAHLAENSRVVKLFSHEREAGGTLRQADLIRNIMEQVFALIFDAFSDYVLENVGVSDDTDATEDSVAADSENAMTAQTLRKLAQGVAKATGFKIGDVRSTHGPVKGFCIESPMYASDAIADSTRWVRFDLGDRYVFKRRSYTADPQRDTESELKNLMVSIIWGTLFGEKVSTKVLCAEDAANGLIAGVPVYITFEIMKTGQHEVPYFQVPDVGPFNNWFPTLDENTPGENYANRIALRVKWFNTKTKQRMEKCEQIVHPNLAGNQYHFKTKEGGTLARYVNGIALYAYLMRQRWTDQPSFGPDMRTAQVIVPVINHFTQIIELIPDLTPVMPLMKIRFSEEPAAKYMRNTLKLENVNGTWQRFTNLDQKLATDPNLKGPNKVHNGTQSIKGRDSCDSCPFARAVFRSLPRASRPEDLYKCNLVEGTGNRCNACVQWGRPCSWSYIADALGRDWKPHWPFAKYQADMPKQPQTPKGEEIAKALFRQPYNTEKCRSRSLNSWHAGRHQRH